MIPLVRAHALTGYIQLVRSLGGNPEQLLRRHHIAPELLDDGDSFIPYAALIHLLEATAKETGRADFGLQMSRHQTIDVLGPLSIVARNSATVRDGLAAVARNIDFYTPSVLCTLSSEGRGLVRYAVEINVPRAPARTQTVDLSVAFARDVIRILAGSDFVAEEATFRHQAAIPTATYRSFFRCPVRFSQSADSLLLRETFLERRIDKNDSLLRQAIEHYVSSVIAKRPLDIQGQVRLFVRRLLATNQCSLSSIAGNLSMHERTLQRRLREECVTFEDIVEEVRRECVIEYLAQDRIRMSQVASMVGFVEQTSFNRACRRWFGLTPRELSRRLKEDGGAALVLGEIGVGE